ncbi:hypothetical protein L1887_42349 [Cichorium endivia]|nr:hypothetical protein L1887_42349 [Cichorium endivia]
MRMLMNRICIAFSGSFSRNARAERNQRQRCNGRGELEREEVLDVVKDALALFDGGEDAWQSWRGASLTPSPVMAHHGSVGLEGGDDRHLVPRRGARKTPTPTRCAPAADASTGKGQGARIEAAAGARGEADDAEGLGSKACRPPAGTWCATLRRAARASHSAPSTVVHLSMTTSYAPLTYTVSAAPTPAVDSTPVDRHELGAEDVDERHVGRLAHVGAELVAMRVVAQVAREEDARERLRVLVREVVCHVDDGVFGGEAADDGHLVGGERAGLVRADDRDRAERLDRRQLLDDGLAVRHAQHAERERDGDDDGQALGDGGYGERHADALCELIHAELERRALLDDLIHHAKDHAELGAGARADDDAAAVARLDERAHEGDVFRAR